jgi:cell division protein FtsW (lipid II flippase)
MHSSRPHLILLAVPVVVASMAILSLAAVDRRLWTIQLLAVCLACTLAAIGGQIGRRTGAALPARSILVITLLGIAAPLLSHEAGPARWVSLGPLRLYIAPVLLPSFLVACATSIARRGSSEHLAFAAIVCATALLAIQPDASQALALLTAVVITRLQSRTRSAASIAALLLTVLSSAWAFTRPDPLTPVPHVEGVFALSFDHSLLAGTLVVASAIAFVAGLHLSSSVRRSWLSAVAAYYAVLFVCSVAGLTPAPLIGYGAGPLLGFGLLLATASLNDAESAASQFTQADAASRRG